MGDSLLSQVTATGREKTCAREGLDWISGIIPQEEW